MKIEILSPDGFSIDMQVHTSMKNAKIALNNFVKRYEQQGYYSTIKNGQRYLMPLNELIENCTLIKK
jgi:hypothetical protein